MLESFLFALALAVGMTPQLLPAIISINLAHGAKRMALDKVIVKRLASIENFGSMNVLCTDKTGTLTEGIMRVVRTDFSSESMGLYVMALCNNLADPLEATLWNKVKEKGIDPHAVSEKCKRTHEVPFSSEKKYMLTVNNIDGKEIAFLKGAPEILQELCDFESSERQRIAKELEEWSNSGLKVLAITFKNEGNRQEMKD